ncbi:MAG TPA: retropepsin-like aspartic protease, partial [Rhizomicrobium sp.]|nr:retropepsin-like aspartic protease [Rhizomicrobium sp.]
WNEEAAKLDLALVEGRRMMDGGGRFSEDLARVGSFTVGSMKTGGFYTQVSADPQFADARSDGVLGSDMMIRYDIDLDFARQRLNFFTPEQCEGAGVYWAPGKITQVRTAAYATVVYVPVTLDGHTIIAALDTSADRTILNPEVASRLFGLTPASTGTAAVVISGALIKAGLHRFSSLGFGGLTFGNPEIAVPVDTLTKNTREFHAAKTARDTFRLSEFLPEMVIGMDVLKQTHLYISFQNRRVYVSAAGEGQPLQPQQLKTSWFNVWRYGYDMYWRDHHPFVTF